jgi:hypothetical protein
MNVFLCVSIDCECDKGPAWRVRHPLAFSGITDGIFDRLQPLFRRHRARPTYLLSPEVMRDPESVDGLRAIAGECELGTHLHGELVDADAPLPDVTSDFQRDYPPAVERARLTRLSEQFRTVFGFAPRSFRAGRFGVGAHTLGFLDELGYAVESSVTPFVDWAASGAPGLSFVGAPTQPYHPDPGAPERRGASRLVEVPVTIRPRALPLVGRWLPPRWLRPTRASGAALIDLALDEIRSARASARRAERAEELLAGLRPARMPVRSQRPVVLNAMLHNVEVIPGASPYAATATRADAILARLGALLDFARREAIRVVGLGDVPELLA